MQNSGLSKYTLKGGFQLEDEIKYNMADKTLKLVSYNSTGLASDKCEFITDIIDIYKPSVLLLQETWLINSRLNMLNNIHPDYIDNGVSGMHEDEQILGRTKGGLGILWKMFMVETVEFKNIPNTNSACAIVINCGNDSVLCINIYMPVDNQKINICRS